MQQEPSLAEDVKSAREKMVVSRLHYTTIVKTLEGQHEDFRYLLSGIDRTRRIPLLWRKRNIQANMTVRDGQNNHLPYLPSRISDAFCAEYLLQLWKSFEGTLGESAVPSWVPEARERSFRLTRFEYDINDAEAAREEWAQASSAFAGNPAFARLRVFIEHLCEYYIPVVEVRDTTEEFVFLHHGVDVSTSSRQVFRSKSGKQGAVYSAWEVLNLAVTGRIRLDVPILIDAFIAPPWKTTESLHVRVMLPDGMVLNGPINLVPRKLFIETTILDLTEVTEEYVYSYVGKLDATRYVQKLTEERDRTRTMSVDFQATAQALREKSEAVSNQRRTREIPPHGQESPSPPSRDVLSLYVGLFVLARQALRLRRQRRLLEAGEKPVLRVRLQMSWTMKMLLGLLWVVIAITVVIDGLDILGVNTYVALLGSLLLVVLTLALFSLDKPFLRIPFFGHTVLSTAVFLAVPLLPWLAQSVFSLA